MTDLSWQDRAACKDSDPELFFASDGETLDARLAREARAEAICATCPVTAACRMFAMSMGHRDGIWGGREFGQRLCRNKLHLMTSANIMKRNDGSANCRECRRAADQRYRVNREARAS